MKACEQGFFLLFDIQSHFDHVNHKRLVAIVADLGFVPELVNWCRSFLKDCTVRLKFNGQTSDPFDFAVGTPQGSPVSLVLSTIYMLPLLHHMRGLNKTSLSMYIDDGAIFACGRDWNEIEEAMQAGYTTCIEWLTRAGLNVESDKTKLIFFWKKMGEIRSAHTDPPSTPLLQHILPSLGSEYASLPWLLLRHTTNLIAPYKHHVQ
jgi:Reverse transcriptase (RNA-dependent DNA polymerase)